MNIDATNHPDLRSWVESANDEASDFPIQNLPYGRFRRAGSDEPWRLGVAIGDEVLDLKAAIASGFELHDSLALDTLNTFMAQGAALRRRARLALSGALKTGSAHQPKLERCLVRRADIELGVPCRIGDYTDFYTGIHHATAVGKLFRPDQPLLPNYKWVPIGYHGRASSVGVSGMSFPRPLGQFKTEGEVPEFGPCRRLDYEVELGAFIGPGNTLGQPVSMARADDSLFGVVLLNDWSARDIQAWEYQPLGPFLSKSFATTVSPWVVTMEALSPFRVAFERPAGDPSPLPYLDSSENRQRGAFDITLEAWLQTAKMRSEGAAPVRLTQSNFRDAYWTLAQLVAHHTVNGCNLQSGDLLGTGTQSGPELGQGGSLLELTQAGKSPITLPNGETRGFLLDGDTVVLRAFCARSGARRIGFGDCAASVSVAVNPDAPPPN